MEKIKLPEDLIEKLKKHNDKNLDLVMRIGQIEIEINSLSNQKTILLSKVQETNLEGEELAKILQDKYGDGDINLDTMEFTPLS